MHTVSTIIHDYTKTIIINPLVLKIFINLWNKLFKVCQSENIATQK